MTSSPRTLAEILDPLKPADFLRNHLGKQFFYLPGQRGKFAGLLPWQDLNHLLRHHRLDIPRLRLVREGKPIPAESFLVYHTNRRRPELRVPRLRAAEITRLLRAGATLIVDAVDEICEPVTQLAEDLEFALRSRIQVNLYAGWRRSHGFDLHWDDHDVLILQLSGRKHWKVYPMTREHPLPADNRLKLEPPQNPVWEGMLQDGDVLYMPRGWWHVAVPLDEPTLHLTVGLHNRTGMDMLAWFQERLRESAAVRQDVPRFGSEAEQADWLARVRQAWLDAWRPEILRDFLEHTDGRSAPRPDFALPWSATPDGLPPEGTAFRVKWIVTRPVEFEQIRPGAIAFSRHGKRWTFAASARPLLEMLQTRRIGTIEELCSAVSGTLDLHTVKAFVRELSDAGLVTIVPDEPYV